MPVTRRGNVYGALDMGLAPTLLPGRASAGDPAARAALADAWGGPLPDGEGRDAAGILAAAAAGEVDALILVGSDPYADFPDRALASQALDRAGFVVALDLFLTDSSRRADVVLPVEGFAESEGTVTNLEGRVQKVNRLVPPPGAARPSWAVFDDLAARLGRSLGAAGAGALAKEIAAVAPAYAGVGWELVDWGRGREGFVLPLPDGDQPLRFEPRDPGLDVASPGMALHLGRVLYDEGVHIRFGPSLAKLVPVASAHLHPGDAARLGLEQGSLVRLATDRGSVDLPLALDETLLPGTVYVPFNLDGSSQLGGSVAVEVRR